MRRKTRIIDHVKAGISAEDMATAARVTTVLRKAAFDYYTSIPNGLRGRADAVRRDVVETLMRAGGYTTQRDRKEAFVAWLKTAGRTTMHECSRKRCEIKGDRQGTNEHMITAAIIRQLEEEGLVLYVRGDRGDPGLVKWIGPTHEGET